MAGFQCAGCGEWNETSVDASAGRRQQYVEDCQVCWKPNVLRVEYDGEEWRASARFVLDRKAREDRARADRADRVADHHDRKPAGAAMEYVTNQIGHSRDPGA